MLMTVFTDLDKWVDNENRERVEAGMLMIAKCEIRVLGQTALLEAKLDLHVASTMDVDVYANYEYAVKKRFEELLNAAGKQLDPVGHEAWMPKETEYLEYFIGDWVRAYLAKPEYIMISKAKKAPTKNDLLISEYIASGACERFFELAKKYQIDLESFVK